LYPEWTFGSIGYFDFVGWGLRVRKMAGPGNDACAGLYGLERELTLGTDQQGADALKGQYIPAKGNTLGKTSGVLGVLPRAGCV